MFDGKGLANARADAQHVARLARDLIGLLDHTARAFDGLAAVSPEAVAIDLLAQARTIREIRVRFAGPPRELAAER